MFLKFIWIEAFAKPVETKNTMRYVSVNQIFDKIYQHPMASLVAITLQHSVGGVK